MECKQKNCDADAEFMVYWATDRVPSCEVHTNQLRGVADAMGMPPLQVNSIVAEGIETPVLQHPCSVVRAVAPFSCRSCMELPFLS